MEAIMNEIRIYTNFEIGRILGVMSTMNSERLMEKYNEYMSNEEIWQLVNLSKKLEKSIKSKYRDNARKRILKTKSLTKKARIDICTVCENWWIEENFNFEKAYISIKKGMI